MLLKKRANENKNVTFPNIADKIKFKTYELNKNAATWPAWFLRNVDCFSSANIMKLTTKTKKDP